MEEVWKDIKGYENKYQVSNTGKVRSLNYNNTKEIKELKQYINWTGLANVCLSKNNKRKFYMVARLVAETFIPNPLFKEHVIHISKDKLDNSVENLAWAYISEEKHHTYNKGSRKGNPTYTKISYNGKNYNNYKDIAKDLKINQRTFYKRLYELDWSLYEALEIPIGKKGGEKI